MEDVMYAFDTDGAALWKVNMVTKTAEREIPLDAKGNPRFSVLLDMGNKLLLCPGEGSEIALYDPKKREMICEAQYTQGTSNNSYLVAENKFLGGYGVGDQAYIVGARVPKILKVRYVHDEIVYDTIWEKNKGDSSRETDFPFWFSNGFQSDGKKLLAAGGRLCSLFALDIETCCCQMYEIPIEYERIHGVLAWKSNVWILITDAKATYLVKWHYNGTLGEKLHIEDSGNEMIYWWNPIEVSGLFYLFQKNGNHVYQFDPMKKDISLICTISKEMGEIPPQTGIYSVRLIGVHNKRIVFTSGWNKRWFEYDTESGQILTFYIEIIDKNYVEQYWKKRWDGIVKERDVVYEDEIPLPYYVRNVLLRS